MIDREYTIEGDEGDEYEAPEVVVLGTVDELTAGAGGEGLDVLFGAEGSGPTVL